MSEDGGGACGARDRLPPGLRTLLPCSKLCIFFLRLAAEAVCSAESSDVVHTGPDATIWKQARVADEHLLTLLNHHLRSEEAPEHASRAGFSTQNALSLRRVFVPWHKDESCVVERLRKYDSILDASIRSKSEAQEQLAVELALSTDVFSARPFAKPKAGLSEDNRVGTTSRAAEATTLSKTGPPTPSAVIVNDVSTDRELQRARQGGSSSKNRISVPILTQSPIPMTSHTTTGNQSPGAPSFQAPCGKAEADLKTPLHHW
ncbi:hypothetical protein EDB84DRAFT_1439799 [Lactarius hengduanensis]|nr:hypothetical protein EDB84DRAFT_1439799 [Lactarius hengduanensis]